MESSALDYVAQACMDLTDLLNVAESDSERETLLTNHIKKVWGTVTAVDDFKTNLEWVNVSEAISLPQHCSDKIVVLDFWTYCCINCYHILPDLAHLESLYPIEKGVVVIGVHCAKFTNEKSSSNVLAAVQRHSIHHPVVNDADSCMWETLGIRCWPTLLILGPGNKPLFVLTGEGHRDALLQYVSAAHAHFGAQLDTRALPALLARPAPPARDDDGLLCFPTKVAVNPWYRGRPEESYLAIADSGHHRVLVIDCAGRLLRAVGGPDAGFRDGKNPKLNFPQGLCWLSGNVIAVCDTNNHCLRALHLDERTAETLAGTGERAAPGDKGGKCLGLQALSSPWDVVLFTTPDMDMSVRAPPPPPPPPNAGAAPAAPAAPAPNGHEERAPDAEGVESKEAAGKADGALRRVLLIACAGSHQLWALFLDTTIWWKYKTYTEGTCVCVAGSGAEAARNSAYPQSAAFAQPSGLALRTGSSPEVFVADAESSSVRRVALSSGHVSTLAGGDRNPLNLFAFGDADAVGGAAKLQHPLGLAYCARSRSLLVADSYNHKLKRVDVATQRVQSLQPRWAESERALALREPAGLALSADGVYLYVADTNHHRIVLVNTAKDVCQELRLRPASEPAASAAPVAPVAPVAPAAPFAEPENLILYKNDLFINRKCGNLIIYFNVHLEAEKAVSFSAHAPQHWQLSVRDARDRDVTEEQFEMVRCRAQGTRLPGRVELRLRRRTDSTHYRLYLAFNTALCDHKVCFSHRFTIRSTILVRDSVKMVESYKITCKVNPVNRYNVTQLDSSGDAPAQ